MADKDWNNFELTDEMVAFVRSKYGTSWMESDEISDEILDDLWEYAHKETEVVKGLCT